MVDELNEALGKELDECLMAIARLRKATAAATEMASDVSLLSGPQASAVRKLLQKIRGELEALDEVHTDIVLGDDEVSEE